MSRATVDTNPSESEPLVEIQNLKTYYGGDGLLSGRPVRAVDGVTFDIHRGETVGLVGESGCGKTTLGRTLVNLETATDGTVRFDGTDVTRLSGEALRRWRRNTQMVFQDPESSLNERITVGELVREPLDVHEWKTPPERRERVRELLDVVGLRSEHYYRYPHQFSGGQKQRIAIARALGLEPEFLVLDEPTSALDVSVQAKILNLLGDLQSEFDLTYLFISHDLSVVRHICDRVAVMYLGQIMELGPTDEIFQDPANPYTYALLSAIPEPDPSIETDRITLRGTPPNPRNPPTGCPFTTRCPMKIRPNDYADLNDDLWEAIEIYRDVIRERADVERSLTVRARETLGLSTRFDDVEEIREELFGDLTVPSEIDERLDIATEHVSAGNETEAREHMRSEFGSECDRENPEDHPVGARHSSRCHRHESNCADPRDVIDRDF